jgi:hypothetical protein
MQTLHQILQTFVLDDKKCLVTLNAIHIMVSVSCSTKMEWGYYRAYIYTLLPFDKVEQTNCSQKSCYTS